MRKRPSQIATRRTANRAEELIGLCGTGMQARERIIMSLMNELGIPPSAAVRHFNDARKRMGVKPNDQNRLRRT